jgi:hypothetical protein
MVHAWLSGSRACRARHIGSSRFDRTRPIGQIRTAPEVDRQGPGGIPTARVGRWSHVPTATATTPRDPTAAEDGGFEPPRAFTQHAFQVLRGGLLGECSGASAQVSGRHKHRRQHMDQLGSGRTATRTATRLTRWPPPGGQPLQVELEQMRASPHAVVANRPLGCQQPTGRPRPAGWGVATASRNPVRAGTGTRPSRSSPRTGREHRPG